MMRYPPLFRTVLPIVVLLLTGAAHASTLIDGVAVGSAGSSTMVGSTVASSPAPTSIPDAIKYFIPLTDATNGTYGVGSNCSGNEAGTCADTGSCSGYDDADALQMNLFFDLSGLPASQSALLSFDFDDLDLKDVNDPTGFFESISLSYWNWDGSTFDKLEPLSGTIKDATTSPPDPNDVPLKTADANLITWDLSLLALDALNASAADKQGFWIQLGFGSQYSGTGTNTAEYLAATLEVSPVPVPAAFWLFGTALIGFVGMSRRTKIA